MFCFENLLLEVISYTAIVMKRTSVRNLKKTLKLLKNVVFALKTMVFDERMHVEQKVIFSGGFRLSGEARAGLLWARKILKICKESLY